MKLIEMQRVPQRLYLPGFFRPHSCLRSRHGQICVGRYEPALRKAVQTLKFRIIGIAALIYSFKRSLSHRQFPVPDIFQKLPKGRKMQIRSIKVLHLFTDRLDILDRRSSPVISNAIAADHSVVSLGSFQRIIYIFQSRLSEPGGVLRRETYGIHTASIRTFPPKNRGIQPGAHEHIGIHAAFLQYLRKVSAVAKAVYIGANPADISETVF